MSTETNVPKELLKMQREAVALASETYNSTLLESADMESQDILDLQGTTHQHSAAMLLDKEGTLNYLPVTISITHGRAVEKEEFQSFLSLHIGSNMGHPQFFPPPELERGDDDPRKADTLLHKSVVAAVIRAVIEELSHRAKVHDDSKLESPELEIFAEFGPKLKQMQYGSDEYKEALEKMGTALQHHYANNRHHPEHTFAKEVWRAISGYEGHYEVSSMGHVRSLDRTVPRTGGQGDLSIKGKLLKTGRTPKGYLRIQLSKDDAKKNCLVHRLVAETFAPNTDSSLEINHRDGDKENNRIGNLEWLTPSENQKHAYKNGLKISNAKYAVFCEELNLETIGCQNMEKMLRELGYEKANASAIWRCINYPGSTHLGLEFYSQPIERLEKDSGIKGMNLIDLVEMACDWKAATLRMDEGNFNKSVEHNDGRFGLGEPLHSILKNTGYLLEVPKGKQNGTD